MAGFEAAFDIIIGHEGGYVNDPADPGGETKYGISKRAYPDLDIAALELADAHDIYRADYWDACRCDELPPARRRSATCWPNGRCTTPACRPSPASAAAGCAGCSRPTRGRWRRQGKEFFTAGVGQIGWGTSEGDSPWPRTRRSSGISRRACSR